jgi:hypothetical protein
MKKKPKRQTKVTPGPYRVRECSDGYEVTGEYGVQVALCRSFNWVIDTNGEAYAISHAEAHANAKFILSALRARAKEQGQ